VEIGPQQQRDVQATVNEQRILALVTELGQPSRLLEKKANRRLRMPVLKRHHRTERKGGFDPLQQQSARHPPIGNHNQPRQIAGHYWTRPSIGLEAEP